MSNEIERVDVDRVVEAYLNEEIIPYRYTFWDFPDRGNPQCCALGAHIKLNSEHDDETVLDNNLIRFSTRAYRLGVIAGFDGFNPDHHDKEEYIDLRSGGTLPYTPTQREEYRQGLQDGIEVVERLEEAGVSIQ